MYIGPAVGQYPPTQAYKSHNYPFTTYSAPSYWLAMTCGIFDGGCVSNRGPSGTTEDAKAEVWIGTGTQPGRFRWLRETRSTMIMFGAGVLGFPWSPAISIFDHADLPPSPVNAPPYQRPTTSAHGGGGGAGGGLCASTISGSADAKACYSYGNLLEPHYEWASQSIGIATSSTVGLSAFTFAGFSAIENVYLAPQDW